MGALRFKADQTGAFLADEKKYKVPAWTSIRELEDAATELSLIKDCVKKWRTVAEKHGISRHETTFMEVCFTIAE